MLAELTTDIGELEDAPNCAKETKHTIILLLEKKAMEQSEQVHSLLKGIKKSSDVD